MQLGVPESRKHNTLLIRFRLLMHSVMALLSWRGVAALASGTSMTVSMSLTQPPVAEEQTGSFSEKSVTGGTMLPLSLADGAGTLTFPAISVKPGQAGVKLPVTYWPGKGGMRGGQLEISLPATWRLRGKSDHHQQRSGSGA